MKNKTCIFIVLFLVVFTLSSFVQIPTKQPEKTYIKAPNNIVERWIVRKINNKIEKISTNPAQKSKSKFKIKRWLKGLLICVGGYFVGGLITAGLILAGIELLGPIGLFLIILGVLAAHITIFLLIYGFIMFIKGLINKD